jgi:predicted RNA-binding Zn ribbon-like protein
VRSTTGSEPRLPFSWVGGDLALDFHNTVSWSSDELSQERLRDFADLAAWAAEAGLLRRTQPIGAAAAADSPAARRAYAEAFRFRRQLHEVLTALARKRRPDAAALRGLDAGVARALRKRRLELEGKRFVWRWEDTDSGLRLPVLEAAWAAARLLTSADLADLRACANPECGWLFIDRSRRHNRRWCEMGACGSRAKAKRYYRRVRADRPTS